MFQDCTGEAAFVASYFFCPQINKSENYLKKQNSLSAFSKIEHAICEEERKGTKNCTQHISITAKYSHVQHTALIRQIIQEKT